MLPPSPRPINSHCSPWIERFISERETLRRELAQQIRCNMANLVGHAPTADVLLVAADGHKFPAHLCILRKRAPNFFHRYVQIALEAITPGQIATRRHRLQFLEVAVGDVDSNALGFFIRSIYTEEEVSELGHEVQHQHEDVIGGDEDGEGQNEHYENRGGQFLGEMGQRGEENDGGGHGRHSHQQKEAKMEQLSVKETNNVANQANGRYLAHPMTSFLELAGCAAAFGGEGQMKGNGEATRQSGEDRGGTDEQNPEKENRKEEKKMFPIFIGMDGTVAEEPTTTDSFPSMSSSIMAKSLSSTADASESPLTMDNITITSIRGRAIARRRLSSVSSLNSLCSVDILTPTQESAPFAFVDDPQKTASKLAADLLQIYLGGDEATAGSQIVLVETKEGTKLKAPLGTLWTNSEYFRDVLSPRLGPPPPKALLRVSLSRFSSPAVHFLLQFLHGGLCCLPLSTSANDLSDVWELFELGAFVRSQLFIKMLALNVRAMLFHFFHRPCVACVSAVFDALPKMELEIPALRELFDDALQWQAANFTRIWKGRVFLHLSDQWQRRCRDALLQSMDEENVVDVLLGCEKLQVTLPRLKSAGAAHRVLGVVADVEEYCLELILAQFDLLISSRAFRSFGKGLALNLSLLEDILPPLVHSLSADTAIRAFIALKELLAELDQQQPESTEMDVRPPSTVSSCDNSPSKRRIHFGSSGSLANCCRAQQLMASEWNPRFKGLCHRMANLLDRHMLHFASSILDSDEWGTLDKTEQDRIRELGLFVEVKMPRAPLPRLSSFGRLYKRSSSLGIGPNVRVVIGEVDRTQSLERKPSHGHATVTSRPSLSTQMEEETATMNDGGETNKDGRVEEKGRMTDRNGEEKGEKGRMTDRNGEEKGEKGRMTDRIGEEKGRMTDRIGEEKGRMTDRNGEEKGEKGRMTDRNGEEKGEKGRMTDRIGEEMGEKGRMTDRNGEEKGRMTDRIGEEKGEKGRMTDRIGEEKGEKGRMTDRNGEEKGEKGRMTDRNGEEKGRMTDRNGEEKGEKGRMTDRNGEEKGEKGRMTDRNGEEKGRMTDRNGEEKGEKGRMTDRNGEEKGEKGRMTDRIGEEKGEKGRMTDRNGEEKGEKGRMTDRNGEEKGEKGRMTDRDGEEKGRMTDRIGEEKGEKGRMTDRIGEEKGEKGRMTDRDGEEKGRMTESESVPLLSDVKGQSALLTSKITSKSLLDKDIFGTSSKKPKSSQKQQKECPKTVDSCVEKEKRSAPSAKPAKGAVEAQVQDVQKVLRHGTPEKAVPSASSLQQAPPVPTFDRQRTHTVMTVEENVRAGIDAYLDTLEQPTETGGMSKKPQSIVRPMPQQKTAEGVHRISSLSSGVGTAETSVDHRRTSRTAAKKTPTTAARVIAQFSNFHSVQNIPFEKLQNHSRRLVRRAEAGWIAAESAD
uniref:BTB domain-containing protein n=1 Tax=Globodera rostochiensis TaxID=31243 RepID=A0A914HFZ2_GLORO